MTVVGELRQLIDRVRAERGFERITVVTPTNQASFYLRRALARGGLFNVDFKRLEDIAEQLAGRDSGGTLLHDLQASEFVYQAARDRKPGRRLGGADVSPQLQAALHSTFRELELLEPAQLVRLRSTGGARRELVDRFELYKDLAERFRRGVKVAERAAAIVRNSLGHQNAGGAVSALGTVLLVRAAPIAPVQRPLFDALAEIQGSLVVSAPKTGQGAAMATTPVTTSHRADGISLENRQRLRPIAVPDVAEEVRDVVRKIVGLARPANGGESIRFARMAVVFEDDSYATRIGEALELAGIPVSGPDRTALSDAPEGRFVTGFLDIFENDFTRLDLTAWLSTAPVRDPATALAVPAARWDAVSRTAGVTASVEDSWAPRLDQFAAHRIVRAQRSERLGEGRANEVEAARSDAEYARSLRDFVAELARHRPGAGENSWPGFARWLQSLVDDYMMTAGPGPASLTGPAGVEKRRTRLHSLIERLESLETRGDTPGYEHCAGVLREQLNRRSAGLRSLGSGVYVGPVWTAAGCPFDAVFMLGMTEGRYPGAGTADPLLPDVYKREIDPDGTRLRTVEQSAKDSRQSFGSVVSGAGQVFMYWPRGLPGEARDFGPARWFLEAVRLVSGEPSLQASRLKTPGVPGLTVLQRSGPGESSPGNAGEPHEYDVLAARVWRSQHHGASVLPPVSGSPRLSAGLEFETRRNGRSWTEYDGKVDAEIPVASDSERAGSATAFETYAACPYRYFLARRLRIEPTAAPEPELAIDALSFGTLIHEALEEFSIWRMGSEGTAPGPAEQESQLHRAVERRIESLQAENPGRLPGAWRIEQSRAWLILRRWLRREPQTAGLPGMRQFKAEYQFGMAEGGPAVEVETASGRTIKFRGQIDRVDISDDGTKVIVYDYKSGSDSTYRKLEDDPVKRGTRLQLPLYAMAIASEHPEARIGAAYWFVKNSGSGELRPSPANFDRERAESALVSAIDVISDGIENGVFPARPGGPVGFGDGPPTFESCAYCEFDRICPNNRAHLWDVKKKSDAALEKYVELAEGDR